MQLSLQRPSSRAGKEQSVKADVSLWLILLTLALWAACTPWVLFPDYGCKKQHRNFWYYATVWDTVYQVIAGGTLCSVLDVLVFRNLVSNWGAKMQLRIYGTMILVVLWCSLSAKYMLYATGLYQSLWAWVYFKLVVIVSCVIAFFFSFVFVLVYNKDPEQRAFLCWKLVRSFWVVCWCLAMYYSCQLYVIAFGRGKVIIEAWTRSHAQALTVSMFDLVGAFLFTSVIMPLFGLGLQKLSHPLAAIALRVQRERIYLLMNIYAASFATMFSRNVFEETSSILILVIILSKEYFGHLMNFGLKYSPEYMVDLHMRTAENSTSCQTILDNALGCVDVNLHLVRSCLGGSVARKVDNHDDVRAPKILHDTFLDRPSYSFLQQEDSDHEESDAEEQQNFVPPRRTISTQNYVAPEHSPSERNLCLSKGEDDRSNAAGYCHRRHPLREVKKGLFWRARWTCNSCGITEKAMKVMHRCETCKYAVCDNCRKQEPVPLTARSDAPLLNSARGNASSSRDAGISPVFGETSGDESELLSTKSSGRNIRTAHLSFTGTDGDEPVDSDKIERRDIERITHVGLQLVRKGRRAKTRVEVAQPLDCIHAMRRAREKAAEVERRDADGHDGGGMPMTPSGMEERVERGFEVLTVQFASETITMEVVPKSCMDSPNRRTPKTSPKRTSFFESATLIQARVRGTLARLRSSRTGLNLDELQDLAKARCDDHFKDHPAHAMMLKYTTDEHQLKSMHMRMAYVQTCITLHWVGITLTTLVSSAIGISILFLKHLCPCALVSYGWHATANTKDVVEWTVLGACDTASTLYLIYFHRKWRIKLHHDAARAMVRSVLWGDPCFLASVFCVIGHVVHDLIISGYILRF